MMRISVKLLDISKYYKDKCVLDGINLDLSNGVYGLLGPNGAGKTTLLNILATVLQKNSGTILCDDKDISDSIEEYHSKLGFLPQHLSIYDNFTGRYFLQYMAMLKDASSESIEEVLKVTNLTDVADKKVSTYSGGMKQRLGIAQALLGNPKILLLDEPTVGLDVEERAAFKKKVKEMGKEAIVILSTHIVSDVEEVADNIIFINNGKILDILSGENQKNIEEYYLSLN
ncbi:MAG: ATP-binding cassette domain-containing protein [Butyrivibrio sp.]|nr:ATP-binding cassette domain-containing protein [Butyrivibrio sp.]